MHDTQCFMSVSSLNVATEMKEKNQEEFPSLEGEFLKQKKSQFAFELLTFKAYIFMILCCVELLSFKFNCRPRDVNKLVLIDGVAVERMSLVDLLRVISLVFN